MTDLYPDFESTVCPDLTLGGYVGEIKKVKVPRAVEPDKPESSLRQFGLLTSAAIIISSIFSFSN